MSRTILKALPLSAALTLAVFGFALPAKAATLSVKSSENYGKFLATSDGYPLYVFEADKPAKGDAAPTSACSGKCASAWPPEAAPATAGKGAEANLIGSFKRADGTSQVTYHGYPLYRFANDQTSGEPQGEGLEAYGGVWMLMEPDGSPDEDDAE
jgi:predicted lipoprotein with Yx(FWY)xxD motif